MITETLPSPAFARDGEPCAACGAPLAADQRYCLHCGVRRREARLEFLDVLDADVRAAVPLAAPAAPALAAAPPPGGALNDRLQAHSGALALGAIMLLTLIAGLLLGHWVTAPRSTAASAPAAPQVIRIDGAGTGTAAPAAAAADGSAAGGSSSGAGSGGSAGKAGKAAAKAPKDAVSVKTLGNKKALDQAIKKGKPITTGGTGKLPPKDSKAPGNGTSFETIG